MDNKNIKSPAKTGLSEILDANKRQAKSEMNCTKIGIIRAFDHNTQRANIEIAYKQVKDIMEDGTKVLQEYPLLMECPVISLFGGVDILSLPIAVGDNCIVFFNDTEIDQWAVNGNGQHPQTYRMHDISDAFALVGIRPLTNSIANYLANGIRLSHGAGDSQIDLTDGLINSIAELFFHHGNMRISGDTQIDGNLLVKGNYTIEGTTYGEGGNWIIDSDIEQTAGKEIHAGNGATGTFNVVTVVDGIVIGGS
jgi:hypothetical protein